MGDSFTQYYKSTWIEKVVNELGLTLNTCVGFAGQSQYRIYKHFLEEIKTKPDVIFICHTDYSRLYHPTEVIHKQFVETENSNHLIKNKNVLEAAKQYYNYLYDDDFANLTYNMLVEKIQETCKERNIKLINIPSFSSNPPTNYGLWFLSYEGLTGCSKRDYKRQTGIELNHFHDNRLNHFSPRGHEIMANNIIPHIRNYINTDQQFHIANLYPEYFA